MKVTTKNAASLFIAVPVLASADALHKPLIASACPLLSYGQCQLAGPRNPLDLNVSQLVAPSYRSLGQDEKSAPQAGREADYSPWSILPECYTSEEVSNPVCVFVDQSFASGRGITIIATAERAYDFLKKPAFTNPDVLSRVNQHHNPPYEIRETPGRGRFLVANKTLQRGDQIFASTPLIIMDEDAYKLESNETFTLARRGITSLPPSSQTLFWNLLGHFRGDPVGERINTNAFEVQVNDVDQYAVLPEIAMMNHDCRPNADYFWDENTLSHYIHATQTIYPGQEITITYIDNERARDVRMKKLKSTWGFDCDCSACTAHPSFVAESDARLVQMRKLWKAFNRWEDGDDDEEVTPAMAETYVSLYEQERLWSGIGEAYKFAAEVYAAFGDRWNAVRYARLAAEFGMLERGFYHEDVLLMRIMAADPSRSWSWNKKLPELRPSGDD